VADLKAGEGAAATKFPDSVRPFQIEGSDVRGRLIRLGSAYEQALNIHSYPDVVARLLGETMALATALASTVKYDGLFNLQAQGDGPLSMLVADIDSEGGLRGYARFDEAYFNSNDRSDRSIPQLIGTGHLAFTVDQGPGTDRYQGITPLEGATLSECAQAYFKISEQLDTAIILAADPGGREPRAGALLVQRMPGARGKTRLEMEPDEDWRSAVILMSSLTPAELLDTEIPSDDILYRLYHENGVRVFDRRPVAFRCRCSREKVANTLVLYPPESLDDMKTDDGVIVASCEFCRQEYIFDDDQLTNLAAE